MRRKRRQFPRVVYFGFQPDGTCCTVGYLSHEAAWGQMLFAFAAKVRKRSYTYHPDDDVAARRAGWTVARRRVTGART